MKTTEQIANDVLDGLDFPIPSKEAAFISMVKCLWPFVSQLSAAQKQRDEALKDLKNIIRVYDSQRGRFLECMGDQNPRLQALHDAIEAARIL